MRVRKPFEQGAAGDAIATADVDEGAGGLGSWRIFFKKRRQFGEHGIEPKLEPREHPRHDALLGETSLHALAPRIFGVIEMVNDDADSCPQRTAHQQQHDGDGQRPALCRCDGE